MDHEGIVLKHFPHAEALEEPLIYKHGALSAIMMGYWSIHTDDGLDSQELGHGRTEDLAWKNAAFRMRRLARVAS